MHVVRKHDKPSGFRERVVKKLDEGHLLPPGVLGDTTLAFLYEFFLLLVHFLLNFNKKPMNISGVIFDSQNFYSPFTS